MSYIGMINERYGITETLTCESLGLSEGFYEHADYGIVYIAEDAWAVVDQETGTLSEWIPLSEGEIARNIGGALGGAVRGVGRGVRGLAHGFYNHISGQPGKYGSYDRSGMGMLGRGLGGIVGGTLRGIGSGLKAFGRGVMGKGQPQGGSGGRTTTTTTQSTERTYGSTQGTRQGYQDGQDDGEEQTQNTPQQGRGQTAQANTQTATQSDDDQYNSRSGFFDTGSGRQGGQPKPKAPAQGVAPTPKAASQPQAQGLFTQHTSGGGQPYTGDIPGNIDLNPKQGGQTKPKPQGSFSTSTGGGQGFQFQASPQAQAQPKQAGISPDHPMYQQSGRRAQSAPEQPSAAQTRQKGMPLKQFARYAAHADARANTRSAHGGRTGSSQAARATRAAKNAQQVFSKEKGNVEVMDKMPERTATQLQQKSREIQQSSQPRVQPRQGISRTRQYAQIGRQAVKALQGRPQQGALPGRSVQPVIQGRGARPVLSGRSVTRALPAPGQSGNDVRPVRGGNISPLIGSALSRYMMRI